MSIAMCRSQGFKMEKIEYMMKMVSKRDEDGVEDEERRRRKS
jgi:hypothetical protein